VLTYNNAIQVVPAVLIAGTFGFARREFFEIAAAGEREPPAVSFRPDGAGPTTPPAADAAGDAPTI
jgi:LemA family